jgi:hypothetical protein
MDGISDQQLRIENMGEIELLRMHLSYLNQCMEYDLWLDISAKPEKIMLELLGKELRTRMSAE